MAKRSISSTAEMILRKIAENHPAPTHPKTIRALGRDFDMLEALQQLEWRFLIRVDTPSEIRIRRRGLDLLSTAAYR